MGVGFGGKSESKKEEEDGEQKPCSLAHYPPHPAREILSFSPAFPDFNFTNRDSTVKTTNLSNLSVKNKSNQKADWRWKTSWRLSV